MNILILGSGGREHALAKAISKSSKCESLVVIPGNPGINEIAKCIDIDPLNNKLIKEFCGKQRIDLVIPGSEVYLENGIHDVFIGTSTKVFGPTKKAAQIESSKKFAKTLMKLYNIPTATYEVFSDYLDAHKYITEKGVPIVLKYDGLAGGKGVVVAQDMKYALHHLDLMLNQRIYGNGNVVIEEFLEGPEFSLMAFVHNNKVIPMPLAQDHKRLLDNDLGPNTGGMGIYSGVPIISKETEQKAISIMNKTVEALSKENTPFTGFLYGGFMETNEGPKVIEFNARFGDPEAEVILPKLNTDILLIIESLFNDKEIEIEWSNDYYLGVVLAAKGYPSHYQKGYIIEGLDNIKDMTYHMGTSIKDEHITTNGGRVLLVLGKGETLQKAYLEAYQNVSQIKCENLVYRTDIGHKALKGN